MTRCDTQNTAGNEEEAARLESEHPGWGVWISDTGTWWASWRNQLTAADQSVGRVPYLRAAGPNALAEMLAEMLADQNAIGDEPE